MASHHTIVNVALMRILGRKKETSRSLGQGINHFYLTLDVIADIDTKFDARVVGQKMDYGPARLNSLRKINYK